MKLFVASVAVVALFGSACGGRSKAANDATGASSNATTSSSASSTGGTDCSKVTPKATDVGVTADKITIEVMADVGAAAAPGLFQGNHDALSAFAKYVNAHGGIACRQLDVKLWDTKLDPGEAKNGQIDACQNALALVGGNVLFNPDVSTIANCKDRAGNATGIPDIAALANDINERCNKTTFVIQGISEQCDKLTGERTQTIFNGFMKFALDQNGGNLHGLYLVPGNLPTTVQSSTYLIKAAEAVGVKWDATLKVSGNDEQAAYTPRVQQVKADNSNFVYDGSNDRAMVAMRKESAAQGVSSVKVWACGLACYTRSFLATGGNDVEGTYVWMQFLPFEEADTNPALKAYVDAVGATKVDSFGAQAWQAALLFKDAIDKIVQTDGVNGLTRAKLLEVLANTHDFTADGWMGTQGKNLHGVSTCQVILQVQGGKFVRVFPKQRGTLDCNAANTTKVTLDPTKEAAKIN